MSSLGEIVATGKRVTRHKAGDRVLVPFNIACGRCDFCRVDAFSPCDNTNPDLEKVEALHGQSGGGMFGYSRVFGGYAGGRTVRDGLRGRPACACAQGGGRDDRPVPAGQLQVTDGACWRQASQPPPGRGGAGSGGAVAIPGVYAGVADNFPIGAAFGKGLLLRGGQTHTRADMDRLLKRIEAGEIDPGHIITRRGTLDDGPGFHETFRNDRSDCFKRVMTP